MKKGKPMRWRKTFAGGLLAIVMASAGAITPSFAQTLVYARGYDSLSLDPGMATNGEDIKIGDWVFDGLVRFDGPTTKIAPALAESWQISEDGLSWTFKLRKGVTFHDGSPFNAQAVKTSFDRQFVKTHPSYSSRHLRFASKFGAMTGIEVVDDNTVLMRFKNAQPALLKNLAIYTGYIASPAVIAGGPDAMQENPVGTGPFKFVRWVKNDFIELARNENYWGEKPKVEKLIVRVIPENDVRLLALQKGEVHLTDDVPFNRIADLNKSGPVKVDVIDAIAYSALQMNAESPKLKDVRIRKAIQMAINRERIFNIMFFKLGQLDQQGMPKGEIGHSSTVTTYPYDPAKAKALLAEAGATGLTINLIAFSNPRPFFPSPSDGVAVIKADLAAIGVTANIQMAVWADWLAKRQKGEFDMTVSGWYAGTVDPEGLLYPTFHSKFIGGDNTSRLASKVVDSNIEKALATYDDEERKKYYSAAMDAISEEAVAIFLAHPIYSTGRRQEVSGVFRNPANQVILNAAVIGK
jgi:peptide/nickel transport system substrate-binding protein